MRMRRRTISRTCTCKHDKELTRVARREGDRQGADQDVDAGCQHLTECRLGAHPLLLQPRKAVAYLLHRNSAVPGTRVRGFARDLELLTRRPLQLDSWTRKCTI